VKKVNWKKRWHLEELGLNRRILLKMTLNKQNTRTLTGLI
jgi:hypothetical protein